MTKKAKKPRNPKKSRSPPYPVRLQLRQEACFGCCKCGSALLTYHHIVPWATEQHFRPKDMMALCPYCHTEIAHYPLDEQYKIKDNPFNKTNGLPNGNLIGFGNEIVVVSGESTFKNPKKLIILAVDDQEILSFTLEENKILVSCFLFDEKGNLLLEIDRNQWYDREKLNWDIDSKANYLKIRQAQRQVIFELKIKNGICEINAEMWYGENRFVLNNNELSISGATKISIPSAEMNVVGCVFYFITSEKRTKFGLSLDRVEKYLHEHKASISNGT